MNIAIIGGGITGLTTALALSKFGIKAKVYEKSPELNEIGAGVWLQPNAMRIMDLIGIKAEIESLGFTINKMEIANKNLVPFKEIKSNVVQDDYGNQTVAIHRGRLQKLLFEKVSDSVVLGKDYSGFQKQGDQYEISFKDGSTAKADIILGCDGINSKVRKSMPLLANANLRNSGQTCWRGITKFKLPDHLYSKGLENWGKNVRFGLSQISEEEVYWFAVARTKDLNNIDYSKKEIAELFSNFNPLVKEIIESTDDKAIHKAELCDLERLFTWRDNEVYLLGDAAHATTPNMGQGACQGIEDAYYFSNLFHKMVKENLGSDLTLKIFEYSRREKVDYIVKNSWRFGKAAHSPIGRGVLKTIMKLTPEKVMSNQMSKLYNIKEFNID